MGNQPWPQLKKWNSGKVNCASYYDKFKFFKFIIRSIKTLCIKNQPDLVLPPKALRVKPVEPVKRVKSSARLISSVYFFVKASLHLNERISCKELVLCNTR